jgi:hypothetical protein
MKFCDLNLTPSLQEQTIDDQIDLHLINQAEKQFEIEEIKKLQNEIKDAREQKKRTKKLKYLRKKIAVND